MNRRVFLTRSVGLAFGVSSIPIGGVTAWAGAAPSPGHRIIDLEGFDVDRRRPVPARLYLPRQASAARPVPLVVFSHGLGGSRLGYRYLGTYWADEGIASLHPQHAGSDNSLWRGNPLSLVQRLQAAARESEALARVLDVRFAVDQVLASEAAPMIDSSRIAAAGHSYGANTAMLVSGARVVSAHADAAALRDPRMRAAILISAPPLVGQGAPQQALGAVAIPTLHVTSVEDVINVPGYRSTVEDRIAIFDAMSQSHRALAVFNVGGHSIFTDRITASGPETSARIKGATRELTALFLRQALLPLPRGPGLEDGDARASSDGTTFAAHDLLPEDREIRNWLVRHEGVVERFVMPGAMTASR